MKDFYPTLSSLSESYLLSISDQVNFFAEDVDALQASTNAAFCYQAIEGIGTAVLQQLSKAAIDEAIAQEMVGLLLFPRLSSLPKLWL